MGNTQKEASDTYIPDGYIIEYFDIESAINNLVGIWKYSAIGLFAKNDGHKHKDEYTLVLIRLWDALDKMSMGNIQTIAVELNGQILGDNDPIKKGILTNIEDYIKVREEQDKPNTSHNNDNNIQISDVVSCE